jgi:hypothetical protein
MNKTRKQSNVRSILNGSTRDIRRASEFFHEGLTAPFYADMFILGD